MPEGFVGWVRIDYEVQGAPELPIEDGYRLYLIPSSGHLETSSAIESGWASDEYYYVDSSGNREKLKVTIEGKGGLIWARGLSSQMVREERDGVYSAKSDGVTSEHFFVGPEDLAKQQPPRDDDGKILYGPVSSTDS